MVRVRPTVLRDATPVSMEMGMGSDMRTAMGIDTKGVQIMARRRSVKREDLMVPEIMPVSMGTAKLATVVREIDTKGVRIVGHRQSVERWDLRVPEIVPVNMETAKVIIVAKEIDMKLGLSMGRRRRVRSHGDQNSISRMVRSMAMGLLG